MSKLPEVNLLDEVAHSLIVAGLIIACLTGSLVWFQSVSQYQTSAEIAVIGLWMWAIGVIIQYDRYDSGYSHLTPL